MLALLGFTCFILWLVKKYFHGTSCQDLSLLIGKTVIITGGTSGIGKATALELAKRGAEVIIACRDVKKGEKTCEEIISKTKNEMVEVMKLDLASLASVHDFANNFLNKKEKLHILINNAGVMMLPYSRTQDDFEMHFGVNHLGHFLLTNLLMEKLIETQPSRIINVSSFVHFLGSSNFEKAVTERNYNGLKEYCSSKLANVLFTRNLAKRLQGTKVSVYAVNPGVVDTDLLSHIMLLNNWFSNILLYPLKKIFTKTPHEGAQTNIYCAVSKELSDQSGLYYSDCHVKQPNRKALDEKLSERLWNLSEKYVGLHKD